MKKTLTRLLAGFPVICMMTLTLLSFSPALAAGGITLTVVPSKSSVAVGDEITFTVRMSDAAAADFCAFAFRISLPDGLAYENGSGTITADFQKATGMAMTAFDDKPYLMVSGFGDTPYNGGALDIAKFTCTAMAGGQKTVNLMNVDILNSSAKEISSTVIPATVVVSTAKLNENGGSAGRADGTPPSTQPGDLNTWVNPFGDVSAANWFYGDVAWAQANGLMGGTSRTVFSPNTSMSRAMLVTVLYRMAGTPAVNGGAAFADTDKGVWYTDAVAWASANGIVNGVGAARFAPNDNVTREQIAVMLFRYARFTGADVSARGDVSRFTDAKQLSNYAADAASWATAENLITGRPGGILDPKAAATRAEVAAILHRYVR